MEQLDYNLLYRWSPKLPEFQCRVFGDDPVAERPAAASSISVRPDRPNSIVRPQPKSLKTAPAPDHRVKAQTRRRWRSEAAVTRATTRSMHLAKEWARRPELRRRCALLHHGLDFVSDRIQVRGAPRHGNNGRVRTVSALTLPLDSKPNGDQILIWITKGSSCTRDRSFCIPGRLPSHIGLSLAPSHFLSFRQKERCGSNDECR